MLSMVHDGSVNFVQGIIHAKHGSSVLERTAQVFIYTVEVLQLQNAWLLNVVGHASHLVAGINAFQLIAPITHFFVKADAKPLHEGDNETASYPCEDATRERNLFMKCHFVVSTVDLFNFVKDSKLIDFGKYAAQIGSRFPVAKVLRLIPFNPLLSVTQIVMFTAHAKDSYNKLLDANLSVRDRKAALFSLAYGVGTVAVVALGLATAANLAPLSLVVQGCGLFGAVYGAYNP